MITLNIDAYGTYGRLSAAADIVELWVLKEGAVSKDWIADWISDSGAVDGLLRDHFMEGEEVLPPTLTQEGSLGHASDESLAAAERILSLLNERAELLDLRYPLTVRDERVEALALNDARKPYCACLLMTVLHAHGIDVEGLRLTDLFEDWVEAAMTSRYFQATGLAATRRRTRSFAEALQEAGAAIGVALVGAAGVRRIRAHDERVDIIARVPWMDGRTVHWVFIVQATCAKTDKWVEKMGEPSIDRWRDLLSLQSNPTAVFAVPHHITRDHMSFLTSDRRPVLVLDRIGLSSTPRCLPVGFGKLINFLDEVEIVR